MTDHSLLVRIRRFFHLPENEPEIAWTRTPLYRRRLEQVKTGWIITALLMLAAENIAIIAGLFFFSSFMSFAYLERDAE
ncbi:MAG TPA: hypothetical protein DEA26_02180 [Oceanospirillales bacterium]|nr:hypothetical protein [Oceanospirillaceae bacterium]HBS41460.1 hypothetical protein [Oceanospirillales bacterium]|tara:strand:+ start:1713 stop:1949 length:237 start_codon:yes stop_codon:yes gene_type:complete